jgi:glucosyl-3-phosphoglycerate phosphatase
LFDVVFDVQMWEWWEVEDKFDPGIRDADLTETGCQQARSLRQQVHDLNPSLLVLSPLTRNLRTAHEACYDILNSSSSLPTVVITPLAREHTYSTCDLGSLPSSLASAWPQWEQELSALEDHWWCHISHAATDSGTPRDVESTSYCREPWAVLQDRAAQLIALINDHVKSGDHENVLLVGHAVLFYALTGEWMDNCQLIELDVSKLRTPCQCSGYACICA